MTQYSTDQPQPRYVALPSRREVTPLFETAAALSRDAKAARPAWPFMIFLACLMLIGCSKPVQQTMPPQAVDVMTVKEAPVDVTVELPGRTNPYNMSEIRPQISGIVKKRMFQEGSFVKAGQPLYQIEPSPYQASLASANATLVSTKVKSERYQRLLAQNAIAAQTADDAKAEYLQAAASVQSARINLDWTTIRAPITGRIGASSVTEGALVSNQQANALSTVSALDPIYVDVDQSSAELLTLRRSIQSGKVDGSTNSKAKVWLRLEDGELYQVPGTLQFTDVTVDPSTGAVQLRAIFPNPNSELLPGLYVRAVIREGVDPHGILLPQNVVQRDQKGQPYVLLVDDKNIARQRAIKVGPGTVGHWRVLDGLKPGERVITDAFSKVQVDSPVTPTPLTAAASALPSKYAR